MPMDINNLNRIDIRKKVIEIINQLVEPDGMIVNEDEINILEIDSLIVMDIIIEIEREFNIRITDEEILSMETFNKMMDIIYGKIEKPQAGSHDPA
jgi:acyl carrier protein